MSKFQIGMVHELEVPLALPGLQVDGDETLGEQVVAGPVPAVEVRRRRLDRQVGEAELFVDADLRPDAGVAVVRPRVLFPGVVAELARARNGVEASRAACRCARRRRGRGPWCCCASRPSCLRGTPIRRCTMSPATVGVEWMPISPLSRSICWSVPLDDAALQIDDAAGAERADRLAGLRVERDEPVAGRHVDDALVALAVGPVGHAAARELARRQRRRACPRACCASRAAHRSSASSAITERRVPAVV